MPSKPSPRNRDGKRRPRRMAIGVFRLGLIAAALATLAVPRSGSGVTDPATLLSGARHEISGVTSLGEPDDGFYPMLDKDGIVLGWVTSTFPEARAIQGYSGPSELLVVLDARRQVQAVRLLESSDTAGHVAKVAEDRAFWEQWTGRDEARLGDPGNPRIVSGATLTSEAMARGVAARFGATGLDQWFTRVVEPATVARWFPDADRVETGDGAGVSHVFAGERELGSVLRGSRMGIGARGFNGPPDVIVALDGELVLGVDMLDSRDNEPYVGDVKEELRFADGFAGRTVAEILAGEPGDGLIVSGASRTAGAVDATVREMLRRHRAGDQAAGFPWRWLAAFAWIGAGLVVGLGKRIATPRVRLAFACASVAAGLLLGWMLGQDQLIGWARHGVDVSKSLPLVALTAVALLVPALTGKNVYCSRICPHGAAQTLLGRASRKRFALSAEWHARLRRVPWVCLIAIWGLALAGAGWSWSHAEPFEIWSAGFFAILPATIFSVGLVAAIFLPQAYCRYGCPTGALLEFLTRSPGEFTRRDGIAALLVAAAWSYLLIR